MEIDHSFVENILEIIDLIYWLPIQIVIDYSYLWKDRVYVTTTTHFKSLSYS